MTGGRRAAQRTGPLAGPVDLPGLEVAPPGVLPVPGNRWDLALAAAPGDARALDRDPASDPATATAHPDPADPRHAATPPTPTTPLPPGPAPTPAPTPTLAPATPPAAARRR